MVSFRSLIAPSTGLFRQFLRKPLTGGFLARSFSQLTTLSLTNGLRALRAGKEQAGNVSVASTVRQLDQIRGMKTRSSVKRLCDGCKVLGALLREGRGETVALYGMWNANVGLIARSEKEQSLYHLGRRIC
ncbi:unnamed protein product [Aspergillus oryzae RIB40]|uniref:DNA, SC023 n=2 Tax=Aspergillus oryzae TaxID=5062 RepID=Q2UGQ5_ASPOR|nr:unnamed protein product [Aspergillus oryzae RIB40]EIT78457.1 hypothetical protein Ao3042_05297 [Aspergillus oryzae 3.042]KDE82610.1 hypothetical protein AO1008_09176 [Aspergillus oryzae 100-8]BAE59260.1 unnamed protein product [Aspergillus oryzae RIB40]|eukprot:EIT78457.1 hypothetical protein Ao3042_05297 [Aspergillus oryzae 3.042]